MWTTLPLFSVSGGHPPYPPPWGFAPWTPFPTLVGLGFASVLGPTRGGVVNGGSSPPFKVSWGDTPHTPRQGVWPPWTPGLPTPVGFGFAGVLGPTRGGFANGGNSPPRFILGTHPPSPLGGGCAPSTPALIKVGEGRPFSKRLTSVGVKSEGDNPHHGASPSLGPSITRFAAFVPLARGAMTGWM